MAVSPPPVSAQVTGAIVTMDVDGDGVMEQAMRWDGRSYGWTYPWHETWFASAFAGRIRTQDQGRSSHSGQGYPGPSPTGTYPTVPPRQGYGQAQPGYPPPGGGGLATQPPSQSPRDEFDLGIGYMQRKDYALAEQTMKNFAQKYPSDPLNGDAQYWLGESYFQRQQYRDAAEVFLNVTSKYDKSAKAPDALLRLGQSLAALKEKEAACAAFGEIGRKYPRASAGVKAAVDREQKRVKC